jgi:hypothetical protein
MGYNVAGVCLGNLLALKIDGAEVGSATDHAYTAGGIGLIAASGANQAAKIKFDFIKAQTAAR